MRPMPELKIEEVEVGQLLEYKMNSKLHPHDQIEQLAKSIDELGFNDPIGVWENPDGELEIVEGHGRLLAAKKLGIEKVPIIRLDHLSDDQRRAYVHIHNKLNMNSGFDIPTLELELMNIDFDFGGYGFDIGNSTDLGEHDQAQGEPRQDFDTASMDMRAFEHHDYIVFIFDNEFDWLNVVTRFGLKKYDFGMAGSRKIGLGRVVNGRELIEAIGD